MTNIVALIAATVLNLQTHLIPVKSNEALADLVIIEQIPMTQAQRVEKAKALYEEGYQEAARHKEELMAFLEK